MEFLVPETSLDFGQTLKVVGSDAALGAWEEPNSTATLEWQEGNNWKGVFELQGQQQVEFKLLRIAGEEVVAWEEGENRKVDLPADEDGPCKVVCTWGGSTTLHKVDAAKQQGKVVKSAQQKAERLKTKSKDLAKKVGDLEEQVERSSTKMKSIKETQQEKKDVKQAPSVAVAAVETEEEFKEEEKDEKEESTPEVPTPTNGVNLPAEMSALGSVVCGSDGSMTINFSEGANTVSAASLAAKLKV